MKVGRKHVDRAGTRKAARERETQARPRRGEGALRARRPVEGTARTVRPHAGTRTRPQEPRGPRQGPQTAPTPRPAERTTRAKTTSQAKARAKARKAKAPRAVRAPLRERLAARLASIDLRPRTLLAKVPFVVLIIGALATGLGITLWLSTASAQRSYQLGAARALNDALAQQKEALERDVLAAQSAPALADAARELGMIPSRDSAHLVQDPVGNWVVVGEPKPAEGVPPPPLNTKLPEEKPPAPAKPAPPPPPPLAPGAEVPTRIGPVPPAALRPEVPVLQAPVTDPLSTHAAAGAALPGPPPMPQPVPAGGVPVPGPAGLPGFTDQAPIQPPAFLPGAGAVPVVPAPMGVPQ